MFCVFFFFNRVQLSLHDDNDKKHFFFDHDWKYCFDFWILASSSYIIWIIIRLFSEFSCVSIFRENQSDLVSFEPIVSVGRRHDGTMDTLPIPPRIRSLSQTKLDTIPIECHGQWLGIDDGAHDGQNELEPRNGGFLYPCYPWWYPTSKFPNPCPLCAKQNKIQCNFKQFKCIVKQNLATTLICHPRALFPANDALHSTQSSQK